MAFYELRQYKVRPGCMQAWLDLMETTIVPGQIEAGFDITGTFQGEGDDSTFVWIRRFASEDDRKRLYAAYYGSDHWKNTLLPKVAELLDREASVITRLLPTPNSALQ